MKILMLADAASSHTLKWVRGLVEHGVEVQVVSLYSGVEPGLKQLEKAGEVQIHLGEQGYAGSFASRALLKRIRAVRRLVKSFEPDLVHAHYASSYGLLGALAAPGRLVISVWGSDVYEFPLQKSMFQRILRFNLSRAKTVFSTSEAMAVQTRKFTQRPIEVIPFGVHTADFTCTRTYRTPFTFGTVKTLAPVYGIDTLIEAFALLTQNPGTDACRLRIVGKGPEEASLKALAKTLMVAQRVDFVGGVSHKEVPVELEKLDAYCALSRAESFGVAIVEAMASGLPVVVSNAPGPAEIVEDGVQGLVVDIDDAASAAKAMLQIMAESSWTSCSEAAIKRAKSAYEWDANVKAQIAAYEGLVSERVTAAS